MRKSRERKDESEVNFIGFLGSDLYSFGGSNEETGQALFWLLVVYVIPVNAVRFLEHNILITRSGPGMV